MSVSSPGGSCLWDPGDTQMSNYYGVLDEYPELSKKRNKKRVKSTEDTFAKIQKLTPTPSGPRYLILSRNEPQNDKTMSTVSPFLIKKVIDINAGTNVEIKNLRNGTLLLKTINMKQAEKLMKITELSTDIKVKVVDHPRLNVSKGVIYCPDLAYVSDDEILFNLKSQFVKEIRRITKKVNGEAHNTNVFVLTFDLPFLPTDIKVAYLSLRVRPFIPQPLRCYKCQKFGHFTLNCKNPTNICGVCTEEIADNLEKNNCTKPPKCVNCQDAHPSFSKTCPIYKNEFEVQKIRVEKKISYFEAKKEFKSRVPIPPPFQFSTIVKNSHTPNTYEKNTDNEQKNIAPTNNLQINLPVNPQKISKPLTSDTDTFIMPNTYKLKNNENNDTNTIEKDNISIMSDKIFLANTNIMIPSTSKEIYNNKLILDSKTVSSEYATKLLSWNDQM